MWITWTVTCAILLAEGAIADSVDLIKDVAVDLAVGPENATYCRLVNPRGSVEFAGFSQCRLTLHRVKMEHNGTWNMFLGLPGEVLTENDELIVNVKEADSDTVVSTRVQYQEPSVLLSCLVPDGYNVRACLFRDMWEADHVAKRDEGRSILDKDGKTNTRYVSNASEHVCSLHISNPLGGDLGVWRCGIETDVGTFYGFLSVTCPWLKNNSEVESTEPTLADRINISSVEGEVIMSCNIQAPIRYCHFRASNGTEYRVTPETSCCNMEYVGSGFDAGECGIRFKNLVAGDSGQWSCHVGFVNETIPEQRALFQVNVEEPVVVRHYWHAQYGLVVEARVHSQRRLRSCRFTRSDGIAFTTDNVPAGYRLVSLDDGHCLLQIEEARMMNLLPWKIAVSVKRYALELTRETTDNVFWFKEIFGANVTGLQTNVDKSKIQTIWLSRIDRVTRNGEYIDMSLDKTEQDELCYFITPRGENSTTDENIAGVTIHKPSTFVSCRITVGPIERSLVGSWILCGRRGENVILERCQHINVTFNNNNNPNAGWQITEHPQFNHSVSLGGYLSPSVIGVGHTRSCHVITPDGEDLVITRDTNYPKIQLIPMDPATMTCSVTIGPIERWMLGEWTLYGKFRRQANNEVRLPMRLSLFDENNPYTQPYNVSTLDTINRKVSLERIVTLEVTGTGNIDACEYRPPNGESYQFNASDQFPGVIVHDVGILTICRISIGPIEEGMFGYWEVIGRFSNNGIFTERRQPLYLAMGDDDEEDIVWLPNMERITRTGQFIDISLSNREQSEICFYKNPRGEQGVEKTGMKGVRVQERSIFVSCRITVGPMDQSLIGNWTLCGKYGPGYRYERCQSVNIAWHNNKNPSSNWQVNNQRQFNHSVSLNRFLNPVVENAGSVISCHIITPNGEDLVLTSESQYPRLQVEIRGSSCAYSIGPIDRWMLGDWTIYGMFRGRGIFETRLPMNLELFDEENPYIQPYNVTNLNPINRLITMGVTTTVEVTGSGNIEECLYIAPTGDVYDFKQKTHFPGVTMLDVVNAVVCRMSVGPLETEMLGKWQIVGRFRHNGIFTERRQIFTLIEEDPDNPIVEDREILTLTDLRFDTEIGESVSVAIHPQRFITRETCHIRTPASRQYIMAEDFNLTDVTPVTGNNIECGVRIIVSSEDMIGEWTLISRGFSPENPIERRQHFVIHAEDLVEASPQNVTIRQGNDLYVRLRNPTDQYKTCKLIDPHGNEIRDPRIHTDFITSCGFIITGIRLKDGGTWQIVYGKRIIFRAFVNVTVIEGITKVNDVDIIKDAAVDIAVGPEDASYCRLEDPTGFIVFDGFGQCRLILDRVTMEHFGSWRMFVVLPGSVLGENFNFMVNAKGAEADMVVSTRVQNQRPSVVLSCSVPDSYNVRACKFRDPSGDVLIVTKGVGQDRFVADKSAVSFTPNISNHECSLRIIDLMMIDIGVWRCGVETDVGAHYGFLTVVYPWLIRNPKVQAKISEPTLKAVRRNIYTIEGVVTMTCAVHAPIRYCYFRASNGTVFTVTPETSSTHLEYVGSGFDAGECGIRFKNLVAGDSGQWSCHVGLVNETIPEQRAQFQVKVEEPMVVRHFWHEHHGLVVEATVHSRRTLRYCRFVRIDGLGFTTNNIPPGYRFIGSLAEGHCLLQIHEANTLNLRPWTVALRVTGQGIELSRQTTNNLLWFGQSRFYLPIYLWFLIIFISFTVLVLGITLGPKKNREWTFERASRIRSSIRNSFRKPTTV